MSQAGLGPEKKNLYFKNILPPSPQPQPCASDEQAEVGTADPWFPPCSLSALEMTRKCEHTRDLGANTLLMITFLIYLFA